MKLTTILILVVAVFAGGLALTCALEGCALHHPVPVQPDYPPLEQSRDASADR